MHGYTGWLEPSGGRMPQQRSCVCRLFARSLPIRRCHFFSVSFCLLALLSPVVTQEHMDSPTDVQTLQSVTATSDLIPTIARPSFYLAYVDSSGTSTKPSDASAVPHPDEDEKHEEYSHWASRQQAVALHSNTSLEEVLAAIPNSSAARADATEAAAAEYAFRTVPLTVTVVVGAAETVRDCSQEAHSQTFLMSLARRFQQLQLLPLLAAIGQQSMRAVANPAHVHGQSGGTTTRRAVEPDSLLLHPYTPWEKPKPVMLVEVAARPSMVQQLVWGNNGSLRGRSAALPPVYFWPDDRAAQGHSELSALRQSGPQLVPQTQNQVFRNMDVTAGSQQPLLQPLVHRGFSGELIQQFSSDGTPPAATNLEGSFAAEIFHALEAAPAVCVNVGDIACAALPTSSISRKLSCWLLKAFTDRILCRTAWFDPCQALSELASHGKPLLSPVVLPPEGPSALALPLKPLLNPRRGLPKKISREVVMKEGATYQLLWQALTRLDDMWALAYCDCKLPVEGNPRAPADRTYALQQTDTQQPQRQQPHQSTGQQWQMRETKPSPDTNSSEPAPVGVATPTPQSAEVSAAEEHQPGAPAAGVPSHSSDIPQSGGSDRVSNAEVGETATPLATSGPGIRVVAEGVSPSQHWDLLPGWKTELILRALSPGVGIRTNVLAIVGRRDTEVLIAFRGTKTQVEWILNGQSEYAFKWLPEGEGRTAAGFSHIFSAAWPALQVYLACANRPEKPLTRILVTGYSLGGAVAALMSYSIAMSYPSKVDAVLFGSPRIGDATFSAAWARKVNGRSITFTLDPIPRTPCREMPVCDKPDTRESITLPSNFLRWASTTPRITGAGGRVGNTATVNGYGDCYGHVSFGPDELGESVEGKIKPVYVSYNHICSYPCWLATNFNPNDRRTLCQLPLPSHQWSTALPTDTCPALLS